MNAWRKHDGHSQPEHVTGRVHVEFRDGDVATFEDAESLGGWSHDGSPFDVIAYSVPKEKK